VRRLLVFLLVLAALSAGITLGGRPEVLPGPVRDALIGDSGTRVVREAIEDISASYYRAVPERALADAAIAAAEVRTFKFPVVKSEALSGQGD